MYKYFYSEKQRQERNNTWISPLDSAPQYDVFIHGKEYTEMTNGRDSNFDDAVLIHQSEDLERATSRLRQA